MGRSVLIERIGIKNKRGGDNQWIERNAEK